jgi:hypothetical protein
MEYIRVPDYRFKPEAVVDLADFINQWANGFTPDHDGFQPDGKLHTGKLHTLVIQLEVSIDGRSEWDYYLLRNAMYTLPTCIKTIKINCCKGSECEFSNDVVEKYADIPSQLRHKANLQVLERVFDNSHRLQTAITHIDLDPLCSKLHLRECSRLFYLINPEQITIRLANLATPDRLGLLLLQSFLGNTDHYNTHTRCTFSDCSPDHEFESNTWRINLVANTSYQINQVTRDLGPTLMLACQLTDVCLQNHGIQQLGTPDPFALGYRPADGLCMECIGFLEVYNKNLWIKDYQFEKGSYSTCTETLPKNVQVLIYVNSAPCYYSTGKNMDDLLTDTMHGFGVIVNENGSESGSNIDSESDDASNSTKPKPIVAEWTSDPLGDDGYWRTFGIPGKSAEESSHCGVLLRLDARIHAFIRVTRTINQFSLNRFKEILYSLNDECRIRNGRNVVSQVDQFALSLLFLAVRWNPNGLLVNKQALERQQLAKQVLEMELLHQSNQQNIPIVFE